MSIFMIMFDGFEDVESAKTGEGDNCLLDEAIEIV